MRLVFVLLCLASSASSWADRAQDAPATMDAVRQAWTLLGWEDARQARQWFRRATQSQDPVTAYYGWEGIADSDAQLGRPPLDVLAAYEKARRHHEEHVLDAVLRKRLDDRVAAYQRRVVQDCAPGGRWQGREGRRALQAIGEGRHGADKSLRLAAYETLGDRAWAGPRSRSAAQAAYDAWRLALNQDPARVDRERLERKLREAEAALPGGRRAPEEEETGQAGLVADPALLALMGRCGQCGGQGGAQRRACAEVAQAYTQFYGPGQRRPQASAVRAKVRALERRLVEAGCF